MSNIDRLVEIVGNKAMLAEICSVDPAMVTRWSKDGRLPTKYNRAVMAWGAAHDNSLSSDVFACLDPAVCPTCGAPLDDGRVL